MGGRGERVGRPAPLQFPGNEMLEAAGGSSVLMAGLTCSFPCSGSSGPNVTISSLPFGTRFWNLRALNVRGNRACTVQLLWCQNFFFFF